MTQLYIVHGEQKNGNVVMPATNQQVIDYCMANPGIASAIWSQVEDDNFSVWMEDIYKEVAVLRKISYDEAKVLVDDTNEAEALYQSGMNIVAEAANELDIVINFIKAEGYNFNEK